QRYGPGGEEIGASHNAHVAVGRHGVPVDEGKRQIVRLRRNDFHGQRVEAGHDVVGDIEFEPAVHAGHLSGIGDQLAIDPDVGAAVDGLEINTEETAWTPSRALF